MNLDLRINVTPSEQVFEKELEKETGEIVERIIRDVTRYAPVEMRKALADSPPTGRKYRLAGGKEFQRFHVASSKGNPPRNRSGALSNSFEGKQTGRASGQLSMIWYGAFHDERGRPFIEKAFDTAIEKAI